MLTRLVIKNIGLIRGCELSFKDGLSVITGETGAGKSMFIDALSLSLGARGDSSIIRHGEDQAMVESTFQISHNPLLMAQLDELEIELEDDELVLRRVLSKDKSKAFANGVRVTQQQMKMLGDTLVDIHGQYDHQLILKPARHADMLDHFAGLNGLRQKVGDAYKAWRSKQQSFLDAKNRLENQAQEEDLLRNYVEELQALNPQEGECDTLINERKGLMNYEKIVESYSYAIDALSGEGADINSRLSRAESSLSSVADEAGKETQTLLDRLASVSAEVADVISEIEHMGSRFEPDPERLAIVDERLFALKDCARKHNVMPDELPEVFARMESELNSLATLSDDLSGMEAEAQKAREAFDALCAELTKARSKGAEKLSQAVESALMDLHMAGTRFAAHMEPLDHDDWNGAGAEAVSFMVATNKGAPLAPLVKVASGGEVSRLMLALKRVFYADMHPTTLVFDEIDTGVGGAVADAMGQALQDIAGKHQVFSITHLPQVAAKGNQHLKIRKFETDDATETNVEHMAEDDRIMEIARMLSGAEVTAEAKAAAANLLKGRAA